MRRAQEAEGVWKACSGVLWVEVGIVRAEIDHVEHQTAELLTQRLEPLREEPVTFHKQNPVITTDEMNQPQ